MSENNFETKFDRMKEVAEIAKTSTWLQGIGCHAGKPAGEIKIGDETVWNYGATEKVVEIIKETPAFITVGIEYKTYSGKIATSERRLKKSRIVAIKGLPCYPGLTYDEIKFATAFRK